MANGENNSSSNTTREQRADKRQVGTVSIEHVKNVVNALKPYELSRTQRLKTFQLMMLDDAVSHAFQANSTFIEKAFSNFSIEFDNTSENSTNARDFLEWNMKNLDGQSVRSIARSAAEFKRDGLAPFEKIFERGFGEWATTPEGTKAWKIKKLNYVHPLTLYTPEPFVITNGGRDVTVMQQDSISLQNSQSQRVALDRDNDGKIKIPMSKVVMMTYSATDAQPFGISAFEACYTAWREKVLLQDLTSVGVSKDLSGTPILSLPSSILNEAAADPTSQSGIMVAALKESLANLHAGDQASMIMPSDTFNETGSGAKEFEIKFLGVDGGGKNFDLEALVEQRKTAIYNVFGAPNLNAAESSGGYNQLEGQTNLHNHFIERDIAMIEEAINSNVVKQLFRLNEWELTEKEMPKLVAGELTPLSIDEVGKAVQRVAAVGFLPRTVEVVNEILAKLDFDYRLPADTTQEQLDILMTEASTRAGDGMSSGLPSGTGNATGGGDKSTTNNDNAA